MPRELTLRGLVLGALITTVFTAANVYLGLKVGLTFASSIPAAVISMALLSIVKDSSILENNIVQTVASAAGTLSAIIFVLPGLVIVGWWTGFPFWMSLLICVTGGILGVLFTIPLRRALVTNSDLPYPEGVAAAEVLKVGSGRRGEAERRRRRRARRTLAVIFGSVASAGLAIFTATRIAAAEVTGSSASARTRASGYDVAFSLALFGAGHLVGLSVGIAMLTGLLIAWAGAVPILTHLQPAAAGVALAAHAEDIWRTRCGSSAPAHRGRGDLDARQTGQARCRRTRVDHRIVSRGRPTDERDRDMSPASILVLAIACLVVSAWLAWTFVQGTPSRSRPGRWSWSRCRSC